MGVRVDRAVFATLVTMGYAVLLAAPLIVGYYAFSPTVVLEWPPTGLTLAWFRHALEQPRLVTGVVMSAVVAAGATAAALAFGVPAALALGRGHLPGRRWLTALLLSPLTLPGLVLAIGVLMFAVAIVQPLSPWAVTGGPAPLVGAHVIITVPWVMRTTLAGLESADATLEDAARGLGAGPLETFRLVTLPLVRPAIAAGAMFAFIVSFGNFALSLFFTSGRLTTLPVAIFEYVDQFQDPTVAAMSSLVIAATVAVIVVLERTTALFGVTPAEARRHALGRRT